MAAPGAMALFADDFDEIDAAAARAAAMPAEEPPPPPPPPPTYDQEQLDAACERARADGYARGTADAAMSEGAVIAATLSRIADELANAAASAASTAEQCAEAFGRLLFSVMVAGFPNLRTLHGEEELRAVLRRGMPGMVQETQVTIEVHPTMLPVVQSELAAVPLKQQQHMTIEPSEAIPPGDARITWPNGGLIRDTVAVHTAIADILRPLGLLPDPAPETADIQTR